MQLDAFAAAKLSLCDATKLRHPDPTDSLSLTTDASLVAVGAVISSSDGAPVAFFSKKLTPAEVKYSAFDRELLALFLSVKHFRHMLEGRPFTIWTDHKPLCGAFSSSAEKSPRQTRHLSYISEFTTDVRHVAGSANVVADALSRPPSVSAVSSWPELPVTPGALMDAQRRFPEEMNSYFNIQSSSLRLENCCLPGNVTLLCDTSQAPSPPRPIVPASLTRQVIAAAHGLAHAGGNALLRDLRRRFVWQRMASEVKQFARSCLSCQRSKTTRHTKAPLTPLEMPDRRFVALHLDLVGPLPESEGHSYLMTVIDRYSRWLEAIPLANITARSCAKALVRHWISRFGCPESIVTDRGRQFTGELWDELSRSLGISRRQTTSYHPQCNGMIERQHRTLKDRLVSRICSSGDSGWMDHLPFVLLGLRSSIRADSGCSPSDLLYGSPLRLPGDLVDAPPSSCAPPVSDFAVHLRQSMKNSSPMPVVYHGHVPSRVDPRLLEASHVFVRVDAVKKPLVPPYEGPFLVLDRSPKTFIILKREKPLTVSIDRLKPAVFLPEASESPAVRSADPLPPPSPPGPRPRPAPLSTSSGRLSRPPDRYQA